VAVCDLTEQPAVAPQPKSLNLPEGVPPLRAFYLYMSDTCNLHCRHCWITPRFSDGKPDPAAFVDFDPLHEAVVEAKTLGLCSVKLTGGEPMLHPRFIDIVDMLTAEGMSLNMETNGTLVTADSARHLKEKTNVGFVSVSLDGPDPESHDAFRGVSGAFDAALRGLDRLVNAGYKNTQVIMAVHHGNRGQIEDVVHLATEHHAGSVKLNPVTRAGRGKLMAEQGETLDYDEYLALADHVSDRLRPKADIHIDLCLPPALTSVRELWRTRGCTGACAVTGILGILGTGEIALCGIGRTCPEFVYGHIGTDSIREIWLTSPTVLYLRKALAEPDRFPGPCSRCVFARNCRTGCVARNYSENGQLIAPIWLCAEAERRGMFPDGRRARATTLKKHERTKTA